MLAGYMRGRREDRLKGVPATGGLDEPSVFRPAPVGHWARFGLPKPFVGQETAAQGSVCKQLDAGFPAHIGEWTSRTTVYKRKRDLVAQNGNAVRECKRKMGSVKTCNAERPDQP